jgi:hypothetical protein
MKMMDKIIQLLKVSNYNNNSVFDIASVIVDNVPYWIMIDTDDDDDEILGIDFFEVLNIEESAITFCCCGDWQDSYTVIVKIKDDELYVHDFFIND